MNNLKRRDFLKLAGIAAIAPTALLKAKSVYKKEEIIEMRAYCNNSVYKANSFTLEGEDYIEIDISDSDIFGSDWTIDIEPKPYIKFGI